MIFERIRLTNLFSYYGEQEINLGTPEAGRNVCLIMGRNGFGKTSLLNSLKLLFTGINEPLRRAVQRARMPSVNQYVVGTGNDWWGIVNRQARNEDNEILCAVELEWTEAGSRVIAKRAWRIKNGAWEESLTIKTDIDDLKAYEAQDFLNRRLPPDYVYFFLFDGEQIQELAEANREVQQRQMERLLGIGAIDDLRNSLISAINRWKRAGLDSQAKADLERLEGKKRTLEVEQAVLDDDRTGLSQEIENHKEKLHSVRRRLEGVNAFVHRYHEEAQLKLDQERLQEERTEARERLSTQLPRNIALLVNPMLVKQALERLDQILGSDAHTRARVFDTLSAWLPGSLFDASDHPNPDIRESQRNFYRNKLKRILEQEAKKPGDFPDPTFAPDPWAAVAARDQLTPYARADADASRSERAGELRRLQGITTKLRQVEADLLNVGALSAEERARYDRYLAERDELERDLEEKREQQTELEVKSTVLRRNHDEVCNQVEQMVNKAHQHRITEDKIATASRLGALFADLKTHRTQAQREALQKAINRHLMVLMTSHRLIDLVEVDEDFGLRYLDRAGQPILRHEAAHGYRSTLGPERGFRKTGSGGGRYPPWPVSIVVTRRPF